MFVNTFARVCARLHVYCLKKHTTVGYRRIKISFLKTKHSSNLISTEAVIIGWSTTINDHLVHCCKRVCLPGVAELVRMQSCFSTKHENGYQWTKFYYNIIRRLLRTGKNHLSAHFLTADIRSLPVCYTTCVYTIFAQKTLMVIVGSFYSLWSFGHMTHSA